MAEPHTTAYTEIACVVDRSGSMQHIASDAIGGFNSFLKAQKEHPGEARLTLVLFDHEYQVLHTGVDIRLVPPLDTSTYVPRGTTALLDAIGRTIDDVGVRLGGMPESERPDKVIMAILTDGLENASKDYTYERVSEMIRHQSGKYNWEFVFLAANQDAMASAARISIAAQDAYSFAATGEGVQVAYATLSSEVSRRRGPGKGEA
jgi:hypothetical protein